LRRWGIDVSVPCPHCREAADATVIMLPTEGSLGVWKLSCPRCNHAQTVVDATGENPDTGVPALSCICDHCMAHGSGLFNRYRNDSAALPQRLDQALVEAAEHLIAGVPDWRLTANGEAQFGGNLRGRYHESVLCAAGVRENSYGHLPDELKGFHGPQRNSLVVERDYGFKRDMSYCALPPYTWPASVDYLVMRAGFNWDDLASFRRWAVVVCSVAHRGWLQMPLVATVRKRALVEGAAA
jgi:hypothetical protein